MALLQQLQLRQQTTVHASRQRSKVSWLHRSHASSVQQLPLRSCARSRQEEDSCNIKRRQLLYSAGILASALNPARAVAAQSTILTLETAQPSSENEAGFAPVPPTYITAPGRVVASKCSMFVDRSAACWCTTVHQNPRSLHVCLQCSPSHMILLPLIPTAMTPHSATALLHPVNAQCHSCGPLPLAPASWLRHMHHHITAHTLPQRSSCTGMCSALLTAPHRPLLQSATCMATVSRP